jgi:hypothetical protein
MGDMLAKTNFFKPGGPRFDPSQDIFTQDQLAQLAEQAKKAGDSQQKLADRGLSLLDSFDQMAGSALASAGSIEDFTEAMAKGLARMLGQQIQAGIGGFPGGIIAGGLQFLVNRMFTRDQELPIREGALDTRVINFSDLYLDYTAVRDRSELSASKSRYSRAYGERLKRGA